MSLDDATRQQLDSLVGSHSVLLFMKGNRDSPQCGFSATVIRMLDRLLPDYTTVDVLSDPGIRENIKVYSSWPTIPQLYVKGEFVGGCDIIQELFNSGELHESLGVEADAADAPAITVTPAASTALKSAIEQSGGSGRELHLGIDARYHASLSFDPENSADLAVEAGGIKLFLDPLSAGRANGVTIDVVETDRGPGFQIDNPNAPQVHPMSVSDLKQRLDAGEHFELLDVRSAEEHAKACISGSTRMIEEQEERLGALPKDALLVFHCHHGGRSQAAAEHFASLGFRNVHNVTGGIDAWSQEIDPSVPRY
ncbi:MAG: Grx4 family monothiol glutaredoxin [Deltaproteobacteria bacterium]|nr:Grx4 family monothiol glutaredoxin [Deltaproteobacteria bacterium]